MARGSASYTPEGSLGGYPDSPNTIASPTPTPTHLDQLLDLQTRLLAETTAHARTKELLHTRDEEIRSLKAQLQKATEKLQAEKGKTWAAHTADMYREMNSGQALVATVGAPLMVAPLAATVVVKGMTEVGWGIASLFRGKEKEKEVVGKEKEKEGGTSSASAGSSKAS